LGNTTIVPILDSNTINCTYFRDFMPGEDTNPVDLSVQISHRYLNSANVTNEIVLETFIIPGSYLETSGLSYLSDVEQTVEFNIINLRYLTNLFVTISEIRDGTPIVTTANVNVGDDITVAPLPDNPPEHIINDVGIPPMLPENNVSEPERKFSSIIYDLSGDYQLNFVQISKRIYFYNEQFFSQDYNQTQDQIFIENSIMNMLPNPSFVSTSDTPTNWILEAPALIVNSTVIPSDLPNINVWQLRITNPNLFSPFNTVTVALDAPQTLLQGLNSLSFSTYYRIKSTSNVIPFNNFQVRFIFYLDDIEIGVEQIPVAVEGDQNTWQLLTASLQSSQIKASANKILVEMDISNIDTTDLFNMELYLPQLEPTPFATSRTLDSRIQDTYMTNEFTLDIPFYVTLQTYHKIGAGIRGLFSTTTNLKNGFEIQVSSDRLFFKQYDASGGMITNVASDPFILSNGDVVTYGVWVDGTVIEFYLNDVLVSSQAISLNINQTGEFFVGSLERANSTINSELLDFRILRVRL